MGTGNMEFDNVQLDVEFSQASERDNITSNENIALSFGKLSTWFEALVPEGGSSGQILGWKSSGTAEWINSPASIDEKVKVDKFVSTTQTDYLLTGAVASMATTAGHLVVDNADGVASARMRLQKGTTDTIGQSMIMLGNNIPSGTSKNMQGMILMYSSSDKYGKIVSESLTDNRTWTLPDKTGTIAMTSDITPNTDTKVTQTNTTASADYRVLLSGNANDTTETTTGHKSANLRFNPSSGGLYSFGFLWTDITGQTLDIDTLTLSDGTLHSRRFIQKTDGGADNITNIPVAGHPFLLEVDLIRWASTTDYITRQRFTNAANGTYSYVRYCTRGTWGNWTTRKYTDTNTKVTSAANHYTPATASGGDISESASGATAAWSIDVVQGVTLNTDGKGHVTGISVTSGKIPANPNTDTKVTSADNHYAPATVSGQDKSASASGATAAWSIDVVKGVTLNTDGKGHVTGLSVTSGKIPANPVPSNNVTGSGTSGYLTKWNGTNTITNGPQLGSSTTTYLRNDGTWATPTNTNTTYTLGTSGNNVTLTPSSGNVQSITVPYATNAATSDSLKITGYGTGNLTFYQANDDFGGTEGRKGNNADNYWSHYIIANHGNGETYYHYTLRLPFWGSPQYQRKIGGSTATANRTRWLDIITEENYTDYTVTKTGGGASGSWGISITGNASTSTKATQDGDGNTISSTYLKLSGGTMTGTLTTKASQYGDEYGGALNMNNSNIYGVNAIYTADVSDNAAEGIHFYRDSTHVDTLWMNGGSLLFVPNRELGTSTTAANSQKVARFTANPTTGQVVITDGTTGGIKSSGYTIATSVPSGALFTDQKVRQSATTTEDFRPILMGATHVSGSSTGLDATVTDEAYVSTKLYCQPKTGNLYVVGDIKRANNTLSLWSGNDYAGVSQRNNYDINTWYGFSVSNACTATGTLNKVAFSVNARNGQAWHTGNVHLYSASGDSPALVFQRGTFVDNLNDWKIYVSGGELRFAQSTANASSETWTTKMHFHSSDGNLYVGSTKVSLEGHTHSNYLGTKSDGTYYGMASPAGADNVWIRTTSEGIIPYQKGNAGSGHNYLGTSTWYFAHAYIDTVHGSLDGTASQAIKLRSAAARTDSTVDTADTTPYQKYWVKIASCYTTGNYTDLESLWAVNDVYGNRQGILKVRARVDGTAGTFGNTRTIRWIVADSDIDVNRFAIVCYNNRKPDGTTASGTATVELWWKSTTQYASFSFVLLDETRRTGKQPNDWVLYDTSTYGQAALPTTGNITYSVAATILNSTTGNAANVTGTVAIAHGGTGATDRLAALKNLTIDNVGTSATYFLTITDSWGKGGYTKVSEAKTVLGIGATTSSGTANQLAYYSGANTISAAHNGTNTVDSLYFKTGTNAKSARQIILGIYGQTYGNDAAGLISGTAGVFSYGDGGPQIDFNSSVSGSQAGALIFTDHDSAATGASWHFVSNQTDWNVTSKRFHARTGISIGAATPNTSYNLYVNGTTGVTGVITSTYKSSTYVTSLTSSAITLSDTASSFGGWICGPTKNGRIVISSYQGDNDKLYFGYGERGRTTNSYVKAMTWDGPTNTLTADKFVGALQGNATTATTAGKLSNTSAIGSSTQPVYFNASGVPVACTQDANQAHFSTVPFVRNDGVMEVGRYFDMHSTNTGTTDWDVRLDASGASSFRFTFNTPASSSIAPSTNNQTSLGTSSLKWSNVYATTFYGALSGNATRADYINAVASNEIRFYNDNQFKANNHFWIGYSWAAGSHYTPSGGSDTSSTTAPNITEFVMGNCSAGGLASVHAKTFILGNGSSPTKSSKTTTIATAATTTDRTITLPDDSGTVALTSKTFNVTRGSSVSTATTGYWAAMCNSSQTGSPVLPTSGKWWHVISMDWTNSDVKNWISQLAIATQDGSGVWWRRNDTGGTTIDSYSWHRLAEGNSSGAATNVATEVGTTAGERPVFYAYLGDNTRVVYNTSFTYNPGLSGGVLYAPYTASKLRTLLIARQSSLNLATTGVPSMQLLLATSSCSTGKPAQDGYVMCFDWDNSGNYQSQFFIPAEYNAPPQYRCQGGSSTWQNSGWIDIGTHRVMYTNDNNTSATVDNVAVPTHTQTVKIVFKSSSGVYSMIEVPYLGSGKYATGLVQVGSLSDGSGAARIIMKSFILTYGTGSSSGIKFSFSFSSSEQVNGTAVTQTSQNLYPVKLIACT